MPHRNPEIVNPYNAATILLGKKKYERALAEFKKVLKKHEFKEAYLNMGNCYKFLGNDRMSFEAYTKAASDKIPFLDKNLKGEYTLALNNLGLYEFMFDNNSGAIEIYDRALAVDPEFQDARWNKATAVLKLACSGREELFPSGWELYEARFQKHPPVSLKNDKSGLIPLMQDFKGEKVPSLVIMAEQGIGDNIMWGRYYSALHQLAEKVTIQCDNSIKPVFEAAGMRTCFMISETDATHGIPICDVAGLFNHGVPIPGDYLRNVGVAHEFNKEKLNVGIVWSGSPSHANDKYRSVAVHRFHRLAKYCNLYSLNPSFTGNKFVKALKINDWMDTVNYLKGLDLLISVDTSIVHMAGSLGVETWMLQPYKETDFRWGSDSMGSSNAWYNSVRIFRNPQDWEFVFSAVEQELKDRVYG